MPGNDVDVLKSLKLLAVSPAVIVQPVRPDSNPGFVICARDKTGRAVAAATRIGRIFFFMILIQ
jgi:hypothetical protein